MKRRQATAQRAEIVPLPSGSREIVSGPNTRWIGGDVQFPIEQMMNMGGPSGVMVTIDPALHGAGGAESYEAPITAAKGQVIRLIPFTIAWLFLAGGIVWVLGVDWQWFFVYFAILTAFSYYKLDKNGHEHSRNGLERYRVRAATQVRLDENAKAHELRKMALEGYLRHLDGGQCI